MVVLPSSENISLGGKGMTEYGKHGETRRNAEKRGKTGRNEEKRDVNEFIMQIFYPENELTLSKNW